VEEGAGLVLVDTSPDLRQQLLDAGTRTLDGVVYTHGHADHIQGLDELREINRSMGGPLAIHGPAETIEILKARFPYAFKGIPPGSAIFRPWLLPSVVEPGAAFKVGPVTVHPFLQDHGPGGRTFGYRFGDIVYSTDLLELPEAARAAVRGARLWIVGGYSYLPHPTHAHIAKVLDWIAELKPARALITHMSNAVDYGALAAELPINVAPAYDGLTVEV
jgi:phosphoribosyl 1,2-cyclic phosphate phosphodiesterase